MKNPGLKSVMANAPFTRLLKSSLANDVGSPVTRVENPPESTNKLKHIQDYLVW